MEAQVRKAAILDGENMFSKKYLYGNVELYVAKAFDEKSKLHSLLFTIPNIPKLRVEQVVYPMEFKSE